jgi:RNA polymerase sigma-70 factor (sigma-E family)
VTFHEFLAAELAGLSRYAAVLTGNRERAHDVLADALAKAYSSWHRISAMQYPLAYVRRIVASTYLSDGRRWSVRMIRPTRSGELPDVTLPDPTDAVDDREHLSAMLATLPPRQRAAIVLRYYLGYDNAAIAMDLGITVGAVRTAISRGMVALRIRVTESGDGSYAGLDRFGSDSHLHHQEES